MPRNNSGGYTLPAGNPAVTGTTISSPVYNSTTGDIGTELTNSLDRNGRGSMQAPLLLADGSASAPGLSFSSEPTSGIYRVGTNIVALQVGGNSMLQATATGILVGAGFTATSSSTSAIIATGGATSPGVSGTGGGGGAPGVLGTGTVASPGLKGQGGPSNGPGVTGTGGGNGQGAILLGAGTGEGVNATGGTAGGVGVVATPGVGGLNAINAVGNVLLTGAALAGAPNVSVSGPSTVTYATAVRVGGSFQVVRAAGAQTVLASYNVSSIVLQANKTDMLVTFANYSASATNYWITASQSVLSGPSGVACILNWKTKTATSFIFSFARADTNAAVDITAMLVAPIIDFEVKGF